MRGALLSIAWLAAVGGCAYDWSYADGGAPDGTADVGGAVDASPEASSDGAGPDAPAEAAVDSSMADAPDCIALEGQVRQARALAIQCQSGPSACQTTVMDECNCKVVVGDGQSVATKDYTTAVAQMKASCAGQVNLVCQQPCGSPPQLGLCILQDAGGSTLACYQ
jgi:hypothetical protein